MKTIYSILCLSAILCFFTNCSDDEGDTTKPQITLNSPEEGAVFKAGSAIHITFDLEDNEELGSYYIDIHANSEGHGSHSRAALNTKTKDFSIKKPGDIAPGLKNEHIETEINIPDDATPGEYHFLINCADASGNSSLVVRNIEITENVEE